MSWQNRISGTFYYVRQVFIRLHLPLQQRLLSVFCNSLQYYALAYWASSREIVLSLLFLIWCKLTYFFRTIKLLWVQHPHAAFELNIFKELLLLRLIRCFALLSPNLRVNWYGCTDLLLRCEWVLWLVERMWILF